MDMDYRVNSLEYFEERLAEPWLLRRSLAFANGKGEISSLAVPVGRFRRGGEYGFFEGRWWRRSADRVINELHALPGFPRIRIENRTVRWGDDPPVGEFGESYEHGARATLLLGTYYGYTTEAILWMVEHDQEYQQQWADKNLFKPLSRKEIIDLIKAARHGNRTQ